jgi:hypothetical protein
MAQARFVVQQMVCVRVSSGERRFVTELLSWARERGWTFSQDVNLYVGYFKPDDAGKVIEWLSARGGVGVKA